MLCTASILNLCCISLDRYFAITRPLYYTQMRSPKLARRMIGLVWITSVLISCPPVFGWKDKNRDENTCSLNLLLSYRIFSSLGSFYIPCIVMVFVYVRIFMVIHKREQYLQKNSSRALKFSVNEKKAKPKRESSNGKFRFNNNNPNKQDAITPCDSPIIQYSSFKKLSKSSSFTERDPIDTCVYAASDKNNKFQIKTQSTRHSSISGVSPNDTVAQKLAANGNSTAMADLGKCKSVSSKTLNLYTTSIQRLNKARNCSTSKSSNNEQMRMAKESKAAKNLAIVVCGFILSWLPFFIM